MSRSSTVEAPGTNSPFVSGPAPNGSTGSSLTLEPRLRAPFRSPLPIGQAGRHGVAARSRRDLWVVTTRVPGRCYLGGNAHTKDDVVDASPQARIWIEGFLVGNEPDFTEWLDVPPNGAMDIDDDDPRYDEWHAELRQFRRRGWLRLPIPDDPPAIDHPPP